MFDEFNDLPLHPMAVHGAVVLIPLAALLGIVFAIPRTREWARWPLGIVSVVAVIATYVAKASGTSLRESLQIDKAGDPLKGLVDRHEDLADQLFMLLIGYTIVALAAAFVVGRFPKNRKKSTPATTADIGLVAILLVGAVFVSIWTYRVGDAGAKAVWNPSGEADFESIER